MVPDVWDHVDVTVDEATTVRQLKREALARALERPAALEDYLVKYHGAAVSDEATMAGVGAGPGAPFIILAVRRRPVR